ncbi:Thiol:disulfide oxidoreductase related to ResA [Olavius sp. associated proteobacterium Delta 1]|nr:Thiol:disulfide oxidoreductase related to ResA [Olavius sp. associated proteobacterium Delta 1]
MKKLLANRPAFLFFVTIVFSGFSAFYLFDDQSWAKTDSQGLDRLFGDMGVIKIAQVLPVDVRLMDPNGRPVSLSNFRGKIVFLNFWTTWCFDCRIEMPHMEKLHQKFKNKDFAMVAINLQEPVSQVKQFFKDYKLNFTTLLDSDGEVGARFRITAIPTTFILNKEGIIIGKVLGPRKWDGKKAFALFENLTNESGATTSSLRSAQ